MQIPRREPSFPHTFHRSNGRAKSKPQALPPRTACCGYKRTKLPELSVQILPSGPRLTGLFSGACDGESCGLFSWREKLQVCWREGRRDAAGFQRRGDL